MPTKLEEILEEAAVQEAARARVNLEMAISDLKLALHWARRKDGRCHAEIHGLIAMTRVVLEKLRNGGGVSDGKEESLLSPLQSDPAAN